MRAKHEPYPMAIVVCLLMAFGLAPILSSAWAQETVFDYLGQAIDKLTEHPSSANITGHDCFSNGSCIFGVNLDTGESHEISANFDKDVDYLVLGAGDDRILELELKLISSSGALYLPCCR